jgi:uracil-DNA glycosylase
MSKIKGFLMKTEFVKRLIENNLLKEDWPEFTIAFNETEDIFKTLVYEGKNNHPKSEHIFRAFNECSVDNLKVVILGMDPYHDGSATGLAFDNYIKDANWNLLKRSPSLINIMKEQVEDIGKENLFDDETDETHSYFGHLPSQGVLLLNTALTVEHGRAGSHTKLWEPFTEKIISDLNKKDNIVWILWGNHAKAYKKFITNTTHYIIEGGHPSPLNRTVPFAGGKYFSECNSFLRTTNQTPIQW